jgi:hypothetical protein
MYDPGTMIYGTTYYWKIVAWDNHGASAAGPVWHFTTIPQGNHNPNVPSNPSPANGSTEISINTDLRWTGGDPDGSDFVTYDVYLGTSLPLTKIAGNQSGTSHSLENLYYSTKYYWRIIAWDNHHAHTNGPIWSFTTKIDSTPPTVKITQPTKGYFYLNFGDVITRKIPIFITTFVIGKIVVTVTATDSESGVNRVEFYIDNDLKSVDSSGPSPYTWTWLERGLFFPYVLKVTAVDNCGNEKSVDMRVWKLF